MPKQVTIYLKGWRNGWLFTDAANNPKHELHDEATAVSLRMFLPYQPGDVMYRAFDYTVTASSLDEDTAVCEQAFEWFNVGENSYAKEYRAKGNRSLSVGDVVVVDEQAYAVDSFGWTKLDTFEPVLATR